MFLHHLIEMGGFVLNHHWHGINVLSLLECALLAAVLCSLLALFAFRKSKRLTALSLAGALSFATAAYAANTQLSLLTTSGALAGANLIYVVQTAGSGGVKATMTQVATFINSLFSGDATVNSTGAVTLKNTGPGATGPLGSATVAPIVTIDAQGRVTALTSATVTPAVGSVTGFGTGVGAALAANVGSAGAPVLFNGAGGTPSSLALANATGCTISGCVSGLGTGVATALAIAPGTTGSFPTQDGAITTGNCLKWGPGVQDAGAACGSGSGAVSSVTAGCGLTISPTTGSVVASTNVTTTNSTGTTDTIASTQCGTIITENNAASIAVAITTAGFVTGNYFTVKDLGAGTATYTPSSGTIDGAATLVCLQNQSADIYFDGTNYKTLASSCRLDVSGTAAMGTSAIASGACATVVTVSAPGVATTDTVMFGYNGDPTAATGYGASATGAVLTVYPYPSSGNVNVKVCNSSNASITPGALTLNWRVMR